ncbi:hypothetical protein DBP12_03480 [Streptomyces sp. CS014]|nr:hypothetical protein DBP12_03480 [Streptomyces sp. CS014]
MAQCTRHGGAPLTIASRCEDEYEAAEQARMHDAQFHPAPKPASELTDTILDHLDHLALSSAQEDVLGWAKGDKLREDPDGFWAMDVSPTAFDVNKKISRNRVLTLWAAGYLTPDLLTPGLRHLHLTPEGERLYRWLRLALREDLYDYGPTDAGLDISAAQRAAYPLVSEGRTFPGETAYAPRTGTAAPAPGPAPTAPATAATRPAQAPERRAETAPHLRLSDPAVAVLHTAGAHPAGLVPATVKGKYIRKLTSCKYIEPDAQGVRHYITTEGRVRAGHEPRRKVVIVPCSASKLDHPAPAAQFYTGSYHVQCRKAATALGGHILVLSALHGLVELSQVIEPYDLKAGDPGTVTTDTLHAQARRLLVAGADVTVLAGATYTRLAQAVWPDATTPLAGTRGIGEQKRILAQLSTTR